MSQRAWDVGEGIRTATAFESFAPGSIVSAKTSALVPHSRET
jgi:hypothetical protein